MALMKIKFVQIKIWNKPDMVTWKPVSHCYQPVNVGNTVETYMDDCNASPQGPLTFTSPDHELYLFSLVALTFRDVTASVLHQADADTAKSLTQTESSEARAMVAPFGPELRSPVDQTT